MTATKPLSRLDALTRRVHDELARTAHPRARWLIPRTACDGSSAYDVVIVGAGQSGLAIAFGLLRSMVTNILVLDKAPRDREGPWRSYARMHTLRSPKDFTGPDLDLPSLTYQSWHEAKFGEESWQALELIPRELWADYLLWYRDVLALPVENEREVIDIAPAGGLLALIVEAPDGSRRTISARKVVLATGQEGLGDWSLPAPLEALPRHLRAKASEDIDFAGLRGKTVAIVGAGATALDNAAVALEAGAGQVRVLCRRDAPQVVQPYRWLTFRGFLRHLGDLDDSWRWRFMRTILALREGFPQATYDRCAIHPNFALVTNAEVLKAEALGSRVVLQTPAGALEADYVIAATGIEIDFARRPELQRCATNIASWSDRYQPPAEESNERLSRFPYLGSAFELQEKRSCETPWISNVHVFTIAATMSFGASGSSINAMTTAVPRLVSALTRGLFCDDIEQHWASLCAYDVPQATVPQTIVTNDATSNNIITVVPPQTSGTTLALRERE